MGLGTVQERNSMYLSIAGGFIWDRKADESNPNYATQEFDRVDGTKGERKGARYADLTGRVVGVEFRTHDQFGESLNVTFDSGEERYIISVSTNNQYSQSFSKALLMMDLQQDIFLKPYDFTGQDGKRAQGISFRQNGEKLDLKNSTQPPAEFQKDKDFWKTANKKQIKRFFEDLSDWYVGEVEAKVCPKLGEISEKPKPQLKVEKKVETEAEQPKEAPKAKVETVESERPSAVKMRKAIRAYIEENYPEKTLPKLSKDEVNAWYDLVQQEEELPFEEENQVSQSDLDKQLGALMG